MHHPNVTTVQLEVLATTEDAPLMLALLGLTQRLAGSASVYIEVRLDGKVLLSETIAEAGHAGHHQHTAVAGRDSASCNDVAVGFAITSRTVITCWDDTVC